MKKKGGKKIDKMEKLEKKMKEYTGINHNIFTPIEPLLKSKKHRNEIRNHPNLKKHTAKGHSHAGPKNSILRSAGLEVVHKTPAKEERKTRYAVEKDTKHLKGHKHSAYPKGISSLNVNGEVDSSSPVKKKKIMKAPPIREVKMIKRESNKSPRYYIY